MEAVSGVEPLALPNTLSQNDDSLNATSVSEDEITLGDKFFQILSDTKLEISEKTNQIHSSLSVDEISPVDLLRLQYELAEITIQQELISKGVSKSTQNVDTLLKAQ